MAMFLNHLRHKSRSSCMGGKLRCAACDIEEKDQQTGKIPTKRPRLKFKYSVGTKGDRMVDVYECMKCHRIIRHVVTSHDPIRRGMSKEEAIQDCHVGMHHKERAQYDKIKRARKRGKNYMPGLGMLPGKFPKKKPKDC